MSSLLTRLERRHIQEKALQPPHVLRFVDIAIAYVLDARIGHLSRRHGVLRGNRARIHDTGETNELGALIDRDLLLAIAIALK